MQAPSSIADAVFKGVEAGQNYRANNLAAQESQIKMKMLNAKAQEFAETQDMRRKQAKAELANTVATTRRAKAQANKYISEQDLKEDLALTDIQYSILGNSLLNEKGEARSIGETRSILNSPENTRKLLEGGNEDADSIFKDLRNLPDDQLQEAVTTIYQSLPQYKKALEEQGMLKLRKAGKKGPRARARTKPGTVNAWESKAMAKNLKEDKDIGESGPFTVGFNSSDYLKIGDAVVGRAKKLMAEAKDLDSSIDQPTAEALALAEFKDLGEEIWTESGLGEKDLKEDIIFPLRSERLYNYLGKSPDDKAPTDIDEGAETFTDSKAPKGIPQEIWNNISDQQKSQIWNTSQ